MRLCLGVVFALAACATLGCFSTRAPRSVSMFGEDAALQGPAGDDVVQMDVAVVERPVGDRFLNLTLWELADEQAVDLERKPVLEDNGLRIGLIGGVPPPGLQALLTSSRSCPDPRRIYLHSGSPTSVTLGPVWKRCRFQPPGGQAETVEFDHAQCQFQVAPALADRGRILLRFTPLVRHGGPNLSPRPVQDPSGELRWDLQTEQPTESFQQLGWELTVAPNEYVVIGTNLDRPDTLGHRCFLHTEGETPAQRLLVIRTTRSLPGSINPADLKAKSPPLALQAGWTTARGAFP